MFFELFAFFAIIFASSYYNTGTASPRNFANSEGLKGTNFVSNEKMDAKINDIRGKILSSVQNNLWNIQNLNESAPLANGIFNRTVEPYSRDENNEGRPSKSNETSPILNDNVEEKDIFGISNENYGIEIPNLNEITPKFASEELDRASANEPARKIDGSYEQSNVVREHQDDLQMKKLDDAPEKTNSVLKDEFVRNDKPAYARVHQPRKKANDKYDVTADYEAFLRNNEQNILPANPTKSDSENIYGKTEVQNNDRIVARMDAKISKINDFSDETDARKSLLRNNGGVVAGMDASPSKINDFSEETNASKLLLRNNGGVVAGMDATPSKINDFYLEMNSLATSALIARISARVNEEINESRQTFDEYEDTNDEPRLAKMFHLKSFIFDLLNLFFWVFMFAAFSLTLLYVCTVNSVVGMKGFSMLIPRNDKYYPYYQGFIAKIEQTGLMPNEESTDPKNYP